MINEQNIDEWMLRSIEKDLSATEQIELETFLQYHPEFYEDMDAYIKTILVPDTNVVFADKDSLKKTVDHIKPIWFNKFYLISAAASIALLITIAWWLLNSPGISNKGQVISTLPKHNESTNPVSAVAPVKAIDSGIQKTIPSIIPPIQPKSTVALLSLKSHTDSYVRNNPVITPKENIARPVTFLSPDSLHSIIIQPVKTTAFMNSGSSKIYPTATEGFKALLSYKQTKEKDHKGVKMITGILDLSGNTQLAKAFEKYSNIKNRRYELSYNSIILSFHKTFSTNQ